MYYGIDLHMDSFKAAIIGDDSEQVETTTVSLKTKAFQEFLQNLTKNDYIAVEASTNTF